MRVAILALIVASAVIAGAQRLADTARLTYHLARLPDLETRRATLFGSWYEDVQRLRRETPADATIDFVRSSAPGWRGCCGYLFLRRSPPASHSCFSSASVRMARSCSRSLRSAFR